VIPLAFLAATLAGVAPADDGASRISTVDTAVAAIQGENPSGLWPLFPHNREVIEQPSFLLGIRNCTPSAPQAAEKDMIEVAWSCPSGGNLSSFFKFKGTQLIAIAFMPVVVAYRPGTK
jgi:hypothetical protein